MNLVLRESCENVRQHFYNYFSCCGCSPGGCQRVAGLVRWETWNQNAANISGFEERARCSTSKGSQGPRDKPSARQGPRWANRKPFFQWSRSALEKLGALCTFSTSPQTPASAPKRSEYGFVAWNLMRSCHSPSTRVKMSSCTNQHWAQRPVCTRAIIVSHHHDSPCIPRLSFVGPPVHSIYIYVYIYIYSSFSDMWCNIENSNIEEYAITWGTFVRCFHTL